jgi:hypothetical protein
MKNLQPYNEWLTINEGGWSTTKTQETPLTPDVIQKVTKIVARISEDFNGHLRELELPSLDFLKPIGSGTWWEDDLKNQPEKLYGDVDYMIAYPVLKLTSKDPRADEIATVKLYNQELLMWLEAETPEGIDVEETKSISTDASLKLLVTVPLRTGEIGYVQVDLVVTHKEYSSWAVFRFTPEKNVKGFVIGKLYSSFGEALEISIQPRGIRARFQGDLMVPYSKRSNVEDRLITLSSSTFMMDIARFFWDQSNPGKPFVPSESLQQWKGVNPDSPTFDDLCDGILAVADTLEQIGEFGTVLKYKSAKEFMQAVVKQYEKGMMEAYNSPKFNKAETPAAVAAMNKIRGLVTEYIKRAKKNLL